MTVKHENHPLGLEPVHPKPKPGSSQRQQPPDEGHRGLGALGDRGSSHPMFAVAGQIERQGGSVSADVTYNPCCKPIFSEVEPE